MRTRSLCLGSVAAACCLAATVARGVEPLGQINLAAYTNFAHDSLGNTLAAMIDDPAGKSPPVRLRLAFFDKAGVLKGNPALGGNINSVVNGSILYFEKNWAVLLVRTSTTTLLYSVTVGASVTILGTASTGTVQFCFAGKPGIVSYDPATNQCQLYDRAFAALGGAHVVAGPPQRLNNGAYFHCTDGAQVQIWKVKAGLLQTVGAPGVFAAINETKQLCCVQNGVTHSIYKYK